MSPSACVQNSPSTAERELCSSTRRGCGSWEGPFGPGGSFPLSPGDGGGGRRGQIHSQPQVPSSWHRQRMEPSPSPATMRTWESQERARHAAIKPVGMS